MSNIEYHPATRFGYIYEVLHTASLQQTHKMNCELARMNPMASDHSNAETVSV